MLNPVVEALGAKAHLSARTEIDAPTRRPRKRSRYNDPKKHLEKGPGLDPMLSDFSSVEDLPLPSGSKRTRDNRSRRNDRKRRGFGAMSRKHALYWKAVQISTDLLPNSLPHSTQGYIGSKGSSPSLPITHDLAPHQGPLPKNVRYEAQPCLIELIRSNYEVVTFSYGSGRIVAWQVGSFGGEPGHKRKKSSIGEPRGPHTWTHWGYSFGGGEQHPKSKRSTKRQRRAWAEFIKDPAYLNAIKLVKDSWETWAPNVLADYDDCHNAALAFDPLLDCVYPEDSDLDLPFASLTANLGPQTICEIHKDIKNKAPGGVCAVQALGPYDSQLGGHLVLHELHVIVEMRPGGIIFFPSAIISHETIPISAHEKRYSLVWYSAGGLFRWRDAGSRSMKKWARDCPSDHNVHQQLGPQRWIDGWKNFSTPSSLVESVSKLEDGNPRVKG
ncbi:hypothetical protein FRC00_005985 [Tulasnella sp. 408]|nr:hypothetical protein FRC00_005985 [Tulasnella sp. 408]